jgi:hypothetical protein
MDKRQEPEKPEKDVHEPGGRKHQRIEEMSSEALAAAYGDATRFRSHAIAYTTDQSLAFWMDAARAELNKRGHIDLIKECLPVYFDPSRNPAVFGPGAAMVSQGALEKALAPRALKSAG